MGIPSVARVSELLSASMISGGTKNRYKCEISRSKSMLHDDLYRYCYAFKNWVEGLSDEAYYSWELPKKNRLNSVNPIFATKQKKVLIHQ